MILILLLSLSLTCLADDICQNHSCSYCLTKNSCNWCIATNKCSNAPCGNDIVIYPQFSIALISGQKFCPRVVESTPLTYKTGSKEALVVKITQIHVQMAFTPWKCLVNVNGKEAMVNALLVVDNVICDEVTLGNDSGEAYVDGNVTVMWDSSKAFDGVLQFNVCSCDLDPYCVACKN